MRAAARLAVAGAVLTVAGVAALSWPAALILAGLELLAAGYVVGYVEARRGDS